MRTGRRTTACSLRFEPVTQFPCRRGRALLRRKRRDVRARVDQLLRACVPDDDGYSYDSYSEDTTLDAAYLERRGPPGLQVWYPRLPARLETGRRRGCAVVTTNPEVGERLTALGELLRPE